MDRFIIVLKADGDELQLQTRHIGPFDSYDAAYAALCELPAPVNGGHKFIQQLEAPQGLPASSSHWEVQAEASDRSLTDGLRRMPLGITKLTPDAKLAYAIIEYALGKRLGACAVRPALRQLRADEALTDAVITLSGIKP